MTFEEEAKYLWGLAIYKDPKGKWRHSDYPVSKDDEPRFTRYWVQIRKNKELHQPSLGNGKEVPITIEFIEQYWSADAIERRKYREKGGSPSTPVGIAAFFNQKRYNNYLIQNEPEKKKEGNKCKCGQPVHGPNYNKCTTCLGYEGTKLITSCADELRAYYKAHPEIQGFGRQQAVEFMKNKLRSMTHKKI